MLATVVADYVIDEDRGWVWALIWNRMDDPGDGSIHQSNCFNLFKYAGNDYLTASYTRYVGKIAALRTHLAKLPKHTELSFEEHRRIAAAARKGDMQEIKRLLAEHIDRTRQAYKNATVILEGTAVA